jgi:hypothetical protein
MITFAPRHFDRGHMGLKLLKRNPACAACEGDATDILGSINTFV